jgi:Ca2+:H+ antiporter
MRWLLGLAYLCLPAALIIHICAAGRSHEPTLTFVLSAISIIPLARLIGIATEQLAEQAGPTWGGLLNATFGNACELIIGIVGLTKGLTEIVKASLTGSMLGNLLLVAGGAMVAGGWKRERQVYSRASAHTNAGLLAVAVSGMLFPAIFHFSFQGRDVHLLDHEMSLSIGASVILLTVYVLGLVFTLKTHAHIFSIKPAVSDEEPGGISSVHPFWSIRKSVVMLCIASIAVAVASELLTGTVEQMAHALHWNDIFVGIIVIAIVGNASEHSTAIYLARRNDMETAMTITYQSSLQIALFATPVMVLFGSLLPLATTNSNRMDLIFSPMEVAAVLLCIGMVIVLGINGETNWFEGVLLLAVYAILAITFFYMPIAHNSGYDSQSPALIGTTSQVKNAHGPASP